MSFTKDLNPPLSINGSIASPDNWKYSGLVSQVAAAGTLTITGSETDSDVLILTFTSQQIPATVNYAAGTYALSLTTSGSESLTAIATAVKNAINADPLLSSLGITATSSTEIVTITWIGGPLGNFATINFFNGAVPKVTFTNTPTSGDYVNVLFTNAALPGGKHNVQYPVVSGDSTLTLLATHVKSAINADTTLQAAGIGATSALGVVTITYPTNIGNLTVASNTNGIETATMTGSTPTPTEMPVITITDAGLSGGHATITYTVQTSDTNTLIAAGFAALINANAGCIALGITATSALGVLSITSASPNATTYARTSSTNTTITLGGGPGETATASGDATETATVAQFSGGAGYVTPQQDYTFSYNGSVIKLFANTPIQVDYLMLKAMIAAGLVII